MPRILVIEDEPDMQFMLTDSLQNEGFTVECVGEGREGASRAFSGRFDLVLLDLMLPDINGIEVCKLIRSRDRAVPIVILTARGAEIDKVVGLEIGADDYITKPFGMRELVARIKAALRRAGRLYAEGGEECTIGNVKVNFRTREIVRGDEKDRLTRCEADVLRLLARHRGETVSRSTILAEVWNSGEEDEENRVVDNYVARLRAKIEPDPANPHYLLTVRGVGYKLV